MTDDRIRIIEVMARAQCDADLWPGAWIQANSVEEDRYRHIANAALSALEAEGWVVARVRGLPKEQCAEISGKLLITYGVGNADDPASDPVAFVKSYEDAIDDFVENGGP